MESKYQIFNNVLQELENELDLEGRDLELTSRLFSLADEKAWEETKTK